MKNHYQSLGLETNATPKEIKKAYRTYASKFHPDKHKGDKFFEEKFKEIKEAYDVLTNTSKKLEYDSTLTKSTAEKSSPNSAFDFERFEREDQRLYQERELQVYLKEGNVLINGNRVQIGNHACEIEGFEKAHFVVDSMKKYRIAGWLLLASSVFTMMILIGFVTLIIGLFLIFKRDICYIYLTKDFDLKFVADSKDKRLSNRMVTAINEAIGNYKTAVNTLYSV